MTVKYVCLLFLMLVASAKRISYDKHQLQRLFLDNEAQRQAVEKLTLHSEGVILFNNVRSHVDLIVSPQRVPELDHFARMFKLRQNIIVEDIYAWMDSLELEYPNIVEQVTIGTSYEGRPLRGIIISYKEANPGVFLESGIHASEWIGPATATWIVNELLTSKDTNIRFIAENFDWYIFPSVNPDGYQYSHTTTRSQGNESCIGVDANRNWDFHWLEGGASSEPCSGNYGGPEPFSEVETRLLAEYLTSLKGNINVYLAFHSYGQMLMFPYGYTVDHIKDYETLVSRPTRLLNFR
ncbi:Zinc carboxypeptidase [Blattella germanica]|nr:Zinc carboxypeptidase [Blattella germanica]